MLLEADVSVFSYLVPILLEKIENAKMLFILSFRVTRLQVEQRQVSPESMQGYGRGMRGCRRWGWRSRPSTPSTSVRTACVSSPPRTPREAGAHIPRADTGTHTPCRRDGRVRGQRRQLPDQTQPIHRGRSGIGTPTHPGPRLVFLSPSPRPNHAERAGARAGGMGSRHRRRTGRVDCR